MTPTHAFIEKSGHCTAPNYNPLPVVLERAHGVWAWDVEGKKYLDMMSAYSAVSLGHAHPRIVKVLAQQAQQLAVCSRAYHAAPLLPFIEKLCSVTGQDLALPMNTGAEAVETAIKAARRWGYKVKGIAENKAEIIVATDNFHGRTTTIISFSSEPSYQSGFGPLTPGFKIIPFGDAAALEASITPNTCAFLVEPIQGEAGIILPPADYLKQVRATCTAQNVLMILDEVQSGLGRTGRMFAYEHAAVKPDGLILGKALGGGVMAVSAFLARRDVLSLLTPGSHGSTFGGNPLAAAVGLEALKIIEDERLAERSASLGAYFIEQLKAIKSPAIKAIRGQGLWIGLELDPAIMPARFASEQLLAKGLLTKETHERTLRFAPPLVITKEELDYGISLIASVF